MNHLKNSKGIKFSVIATSIFFISQPAIAEIKPSGYCIDYWINPRTQQAECLDHLSRWRDAEESTDEVDTPVTAAPIGSQFRNRGTGFSDYLGQGVQPQTTQIGSQFRNRRRGW